MTMRMSAGFLLFAMNVALTNLGGADRIGASSADPLVSLTRPDKSGHNPPERTGWNPPTYSHQNAVSDETWRTSINKQLDASLARLQAEGNKQPAALLGTIWGKETFDPASSPAFTAPVVSGKQEQQTMIARLLQERGLPAGLTSVVAVESAFNPLALSPKGARGLWQLMPATARRYGLRVEPEADERIDALKSTHAAAAYIKDLYGQFQDWPLVLAAYNAGEDRVARAMARTGARDFWTLKSRGALPEETLGYVPAVISKLTGPLAAVGEETIRTSISRENRTARGRVAYASARTE